MLRCWLLPAALLSLLQLAHLKVMQKVPTQIQKLTLKPNAVHVALIAVLAALSAAVAKQLAALSVQHVKQHVPLSVQHVPLSVQHVPLSVQHVKQLAPLSKQRI